MHDRDAPTVLVYGHHDVQPVDPIELWHSDPFDPTVDGDVLRARGASDDKGQLLFHLLGLRAHLAAAGRTSPAVNLKLLIEGEEESGSPHFADLLARAPGSARLRRRRHHGHRHDRAGPARARSPACEDSSRAPCPSMARISTCTPASSAGRCRTRPRRSPDWSAGCTTNTTGCKFRGSTTTSVPLTGEERELFGRVPFDPADFLAVAQSRALVGEAGYSTLERLGARPTAEVNGLGGGYQGAGGKTIVPSDAQVKLSFRLVAAQDPAAIRRSVESFVAAHTPDGIVSRIEWEGEGVAPCLVPIDTPAYQALTEAISAAFDGLPVLPTREGGSGPEAAIAQSLGAPMVFLGVGLPDDQIHAPNEKVNLSMLYRGAEAAALLWAGYARLGRAGLGTRR